MIKTVGTTLRRYFAEHAYRYGGDEFIVMAEADQENFSKKMADLQLAIAAMPIAEINDHVTISYGIFCVQVDEETRLTRIIALADEELYFWKKIRKKRAKYQMP